MKFNNINRNISSKAIIGKNVKIGDNTIIYDNVVIGDNSIIANNCIIGEPLNEYYLTDTYKNLETVIGENALIRSHSIIYCGSTFGNNFSTGHRVTIRENMVFGDHCRVGTLCDFQGYSEIGDYCWFHSNVHIGQRSKIGHFVFIYPNVIFTNDPTPPSEICLGPTIGNFSQIAVSSIILSGVNLGKHVLVGAGSVVSKNVEDFCLVLGNPSKVMKDVREIKDRLNGEGYYPWPYKFDRGMPWVGKNFDLWLKNNPKYD
jgi:acetyltransferase-like isoleucine patch superfamily enzyme